MRSCWVGALWAFGRETLIASLTLLPSGRGKKLLVLGREPLVIKWRLREPVPCLGQNSWPPSASLGKKSLQKVGRLLREVHGCGRKHSLASEPQLWWEDEACISTVLLSHGVDAWKLEEGEAASLCAKGSVGAQPSPLVSPQPEKLLPLVMGSRAPSSDMTGATTPPPMPAMWAWKPHLLAAPEERSPRSFSSPCFIFRPRQEPPEGSVAPNGCAAPCKWVLPPSKLATLKGSGLERERGSCPGLLEPTLREAEVTPMKDGLTEIPNPDLEKDVLEIKKPIGCSSVCRRMVRRGAFQTFPLQGAAGGLLLFWDNRVLENLEVESEGYSISVRFRNCANGFSWIFSGVYGPVIGSEKEDFWEELGAIRGLWDDLWCVGGDFNSVRFPEERRNASSLTTEMRRFSEVIGELGLRDSPLTGAITQSALPRMVSDHSPIVLETEWNGYSVEGYSSHCIAKKLKALKKDLKIWNKEVLGNVSSNRAEDFARLQCWEAKEKENPLNLGDMEAKNWLLNTIRNGPLWKKLLRGRSQEKSS
ncbi:hypothetical protein CK203_061148 [Vitis vinifera]|uniref:Endonuclease/exonuclease/phosphatase domain-containing protein n=1 Tax=Vitis vinifera TaxID=29760 RepID=A0A438GCB2_VITVI|nr:hypothetical protein CK203_061148 [Vitis vinifera]